MKRFLVTYLIPGSVMADWMKTDPAERKEAETKMHAQWKQWMTENAKMFVDVGAGAGKTKLVNAQGTSDTKNDIIMYSVVEAESHAAAAKSFEGHPHLQNSAVLNRSYGNPLIARNGVAEKANLLWRILGETSPPCVLARSHLSFPKIPSGLGVASSG